MFEHVLRTLIDALIKRIPIGVETDTQNAKAAQGVATLLPQLRHLPARGQANFNGTDQLGCVIGMYLFRSRTIQMVQEAVQAVGASAGVMFPQTLAQSLRALRAGKQSFHERAQVEPGTSHHDWQMPARVDFLDYLPRLPRILTGGDVLGRGNKIQKVMRCGE